MLVATDVVGKTYPPVVYAVGREKIREYVTATQEGEPVCSNLDAARAAGHDDLVAPPMFVVVYAWAAIAQPIMDPEVAIDFARMVHGKQEFSWGPLVVAGDEISTETEVDSIAERGGLGFFVFKTRSTNQRGERVSTGTWTMIVRPGA